MTTALVIIDVQNAILYGLGSPDRQPSIDKALDETVVRLQRTLRTARGANAPVFIVQHDGERGHRLAVGSEGWRVRSELAPSANEVVIHKRSCDSFFETDFHKRLNDREVMRLVIGGCMTQFCVDTTCRRAVTLGYDVSLLADGHMTADMGSLSFAQIIAHHNALLDGFDAGNRRIEVIAAETVRF